MKRSLSTFLVNETSMLTFTMFRNAKQDISSAYCFACMDEIDDIGQPYADLSLLHQFFMKKTQIRLELGMFLLRFT